MMKLAVAPQFSRHYRGLSAAERRLCDEAIDALPEGFGQPHRHSGLGLRALRRGVCECRASQAMRIGFTRHGDTLLLRGVGNHDTIRAWPRSVL
jgi:hypothetical protein